MFVGHLLRLHFYIHSTFARWCGTWIAWSGSLANSLASQSMAMDLNVWRPFLWLANRSSFKEGCEFFIQGRTMCVESEFFLPFPISPGAKESNESICVYLIRMCVRDSVSCTITATHAIYDFRKEKMKF